MAIYNIRSTKDSTLISESSTANAGRSEILEMGVARRYENISTNQDTGSIKRTVIKFGDGAASTSLSEVTDLINRGLLSSSNDLSASIKLYHAYSDDFASTYQYEINPLSEQWVEGDGFNLEPTSITFDSGGVSWTSQNGSSDWSSPGGSKQTGYLVAITHSVGDQDLSFDATTMARAWSDATINNYGVLIQTNNESIDTGSRIKRMYSRHTNTLYEPILQIKWDDRIRDDRTSLSTDITDNKLYLYHKRRKQILDVEGIARDNEVLLVKVSQFPHIASGSIADVSASWKETGIYETTGSGIDLSSLPAESSSVYDFWYSGSTIIAEGTCSLDVVPMNKFTDPSYDYYILNIPNIQTDYERGDEARIEVFAREKFPTYTLSTSSITQLNTQTLYNASYSLFDFETNEPLIDYSKYTALSYNGEMNWFKFYFVGLPVNRSMYFGIKYDRDGTIRYEKIKKTFTLREKDNT